MKKMTLLFASLMLGLGTYAQDTTPVLTYENITGVQELTADDAATIRGMEGMTIVADVNITNASNVSLLFTAVADYTSSATDNNTIWGVGIGGGQVRYYVGPRSGGWYSRGSVNTDTKKIAFTYDGTTINNYVDGSKIQANSSTKALDTFDGENARFYLGGMLFGTSTEYGAINGTINKVDFYDRVLTDAEILTLCQTLPQGFVATPEEFENGKVYTFVTKRGWMGAKADNDNVISTAYAANGVTGSKEDPYFQWTVYESENGNRYLYNVGKQMFMGKQSANNTAVPFVESPAGKELTFKTSGDASYPIMFSTDNAAVVNHSTGYNPGLVSWTGGWNRADDEGSNHQVVAVGELGSETLAGIEALVAAYEQDNTEAVAALDAAIARAENTFAMPLGTGVGQYTATDADYETKLEAIVDFRAAIQETNTPTPAEVEAKTAEVEALLASFQLNLPEAGKHYRIMAVAEWNDDARYLGAANSEAKAGRAEFVAEATESTIFLFDGTYLQNYATKEYLVNNSNFLGYSEGATEGSKIAFHAASNGLACAYNISFNDGSRWLYCNTSNYTDAGSRGTQNGYCFNIEEVTDLPDEGDDNIDTAIENVTTETETVIYDLLGRRVEKMEKGGIYIVNGRKVIK